jgi:hypothetical protein
MIFEILKFASRFSGLAGVIAWALIATASADSQSQKAIPKTKEVIESTKKALGGDAFFNPRPYTLNFSSTGDSPDGPKTISSVDTYKAGKYRSDARVTGRGGRLVTTSDISDLDKKINWYSQDGSPYVKDSDVQTPVFPCFTSKTFDKIFDADTPVIIKQDGTEYYRLTAKYKDPKYKHYSVEFLIDAKNHLVYQTKYVDTKGKYRSVTTYLDYIDIQGVMVPRKIRKDITTQKGVRFLREEQISNLNFRDDIPDSVFVAPKK